MTAFLHMHVHTESAAVDDRGTQLDEVNEAALKPAALNVIFQSHNGLEGFGGCFGIVQTGFHGSLSIGWVCLRVCVIVPESGDASGIRVIGSFGS